MCGRVQHVILCAVFLGLFISFGCSEQKELKIGATLALSSADGAPMPTDVEILMGMQYAVEKLNSKHGFKGHRIFLIYRDNQGDPTLAQAQFRELAKLEPAIIINSFSHITKALTPLATELETPQLATKTSAEGAVDNAPYSFRFWPRATDEARAALPIVKRLRFRKIGLLNIDNAYGNSVSQAMASLLKKNKLSSEQIVFSDIDESLAEKLAVFADCDAIYYTCFFEDVLALNEVMAKALPDKPRIGPNTIAAPNLVGYEILDGTHVAAPLIYNPSYPFIVEVNEGFQAEYGIPLSHYSAIGYEIVNMLAQMIPKIDASPNDIKLSFEQGFVYPGLFGDVLNLPGSHDFSFPLYPAQLRNGTIRYQSR